MTFIENHDDWFKAYHSSNLLKLSRILRYSPNFNLVFAEFNDIEYRDQVIQHINEMFDHARQIDLSYKEFPDFISFEERLFSLNDSTEIVHITISDDWLSGKTGMNNIYGFNNHRELIADKFSNTIVLWMTDIEIRDFAFNAADMWAWRAAIIDFSIKFSPCPLDGNFVVYRDMIAVEDVNSTISIKKVRKRIDEIEQYLKKDITQTRLHALLGNELGNLYFNAGSPEKGLQKFQLALNIANALNRKQLIADIKVSIARLKVSEGKKDEALALFQETESVFKDLGDQAGLINCYWNTGVILTKKGDYNLAGKYYLNSISIMEKINHPAFDLFKKKFEDFKIKYDLSD